MGRNGGRTTIRIIDEILVKPHNANQLSNKLNLDYNTIIHHTNIMKEYEFITKNEIGKAFYFHPTDKLIKYAIFYLPLWRALGSPRPYSYGCRIRVRSSQ